jgi:hypothetical protein
MTSSGCKEAILCPGAARVNRSPEAPFGASAQMT